MVTRPADLGGAAEAGFGLAGDRLDPGERLLDPLACPLARQSAGVAQGPAVDARAPAREVLDHVRRSIELAQCGDELRGIVGAISTDRDPVSAGQILDQPLTQLSRVAGRAISCPGTLENRCSP